MHVPAQLPPIVAKIPHVAVPLMPVLAKVPDIVVALGDVVSHLPPVLPKLAARGIEPEKPPYTVSENGPRLCFVRDPDGYRVELIERA